MPNIDIPVLARVLHTYVRTYTSRRSPHREAVSKAPALRHVRKVHLRTNSLRPDTLVLLAPSVHIARLPVHHALFPLSVVIISSRRVRRARAEVVSAVTVPLPVHPLPGVALLGVGPYVSTLAVHLAFFELLGGVLAR